MSGNFFLANLVRFCENRNTGLTIVDVICPKFCGQGRVLYGRNISKINLLNLFPYKQFPLPSLPLPCQQRRLFHRHFSSPYLLPFVLFFLLAKIFGFFSFLFDNRSIFIPRIQPYLTFSRFSSFFPTFLLFLFIYLSVLFFFDYLFSGDFWLAGLTRCPTLSARIDLY